VVSTGSQIPIALAALPLLLASTARAYAHTDVLVSATDSIPGIRMTTLRPTLGCDPDPHRGACSTSKPRGSSPGREWSAASRREWVTPRFGRNPRPRFLPSIPAVAARTNNCSVATECVIVVVLRRCSAVGATAEVVHRHPRASTVRRSPGTRRTSAGRSTSRGSPAGRWVPAAGHAPKNRTAGARHTSWHGRSAVATWPLSGLIRSRRSHRRWNACGQDLLRGTS